jgi:antitoxin HicB
MAATHKLPLALDPQPEGGYTVACLLLPELITEGDTVQEVLNNASDVLAAVIEAYQDLGKPFRVLVARLAAAQAALAPVAKDKQSNSWIVTWSGNRASDCPTIVLHSLRIEFLWTTGWFECYRYW